MTPATEILGFIAVGLLICALATVIYQFGKSPADLPPDVGLKGLKRKAILDEQGLFNTIEPLMRWLARRIASLPIQDTRDRINEQLRQAGEYLGLAADEYLALCLISCVGMLVAGVVIDKLSGVGGIVVLMFAGFGTILPHMQVSGEIERRFKQVNRGLPHAIDLVALTMSAGLDFPGALRQVTEKTADKGDALYEELTRILQELELGRTRKQALLSFAERAPTESVRDFVSAVVQAEEKGNPLAEVLQIQATMLRMRRSIAAEESAARAGVLMMGPLMLIFCTIMMIILGPFAVNIAAGKGI
ncbi:MAG: Type secretion system protein TadC, associated with Flp pilus assembly [Myxococcaceae bacterium]|nr:Type secretion system protein TadC, associated with Flp pilus assembly [Myxococcaceae bacterium]